MITPKAIYSAMLNGTFPHRFLSQLTVVVVICVGCSISALGQEPGADSVDKDYAAELPRIAPLSPEESQKQFEILDGFRIELVASEPLVVDPVAFAFDGRGHLWVVEMRDYSEQDRERLGRVARLVDSDGDGRMDQRHTFVENLSWPTAIWPWLDGVLVAEPPHITWFRDTDGDGRSDTSQVWYSGFGRSNVQGLVNSLRWGVDAWIHGATSSSGAQLQSPDSGTTVDLGRRDFAIDPLTLTLRAEAGGGQHGMSFNRWGDKFVTSNSDHLQQIIDLESWLEGRSVPVPLPTVRRSIAEDGPQAEVFRASPVEPWRIVRTRLRAGGIVPGVVEGGGRAAGYFTGATGTWIMDHQRGFGTGTPATQSGTASANDDSEPHDTALVCDVGSNLVHRKRLIDQGLFWTAQRIDQQTELLRSRDIWFRPVQLGDGPDGALYIADMYREVIEHPQSLPPMIKRHLDLTSGRDRGRIWRVTNHATPRRSYDDFTVLDDHALVQRLQSPIAWQRMMASQLLVERFHLQKLNPSVKQTLQQLTLNSPLAETRVLGQWLLARLGWLTPELTLPMLQQPHPRALAHAIEIVASGELTEPAGQQLIRIAAGCTDARVQLALIKASVKQDEDSRMKLLGDLLPLVKEPLARALLVTASGDNSWRVFQNVQKDLSDQEFAQWLNLLLPVWVSMVDLPTELDQLAQQSLKSQHPRQSLWLQALSALPSHSKVSQFLKKLDIQNSLDEQIAQRLQAKPEGQAASWLRLASTDLQGQWMPKLLQGTIADTTQVAAIESLSWANHPDLPSRLVQNFRNWTPSVQAAALSALTARPERLTVLAGALEDQQIARSQIPPHIRQSLLGKGDTELSRRFHKILSAVSSDRQAVSERYQNVLDQATVAGDLQLGQAVFQRVCAQCHRVGQIGNDVGPPLRQLGDKSPSQLLTAIIDPSQEVDPKYSAYTLLTEDGLAITGLIVQETGNQIVVAEAGGKQTTLDRESLEQIQSTGLSLMPNGLEEQITPQQMVSLIAFLRSVQK
jgi:putative membrane-bound dehydrogenase-like protein